MSSLEPIFDAIDEANAKDPRSVAVGGEGMAAVPTELIYGLRMSEMCAQFCPQADELVQIAARGQHIERWIIPRDDYPRDRAGYHRWRNALKKHHASRVSEIMAANGYGDEDCQIVANALLKKNLKRDDRTQMVEDLACLVFLQYYAEDFAKGHETDKVVNIIAKTLPKMSSDAHAFAATLPLTDGIVAAIEAAKAKLAEQAKD
ncbi:MAG: DUF4202 domain-containing protein [Cohaesibacter sp.]|jgi:hypothetical protein|nr:DUF4202 domain-containing protein [Cohaesibacter sp.]